MPRESCMQLSPLKSRSKTTCPIVKDNSPYYKRHLAPNLHVENLKKKQKKNRLKSLDNLLISQHFKTKLDIIPVIFEHLSCLLRHTLGKLLLQSQLMSPDVSRRGL